MSPIRILCMSCVLFGLSTLAVGQDFVLENPLDPTANSAANIVGTDLVITDAGGNAFVYQRRPGLDTPDGRFQGFHCVTANQSLRWPVSGAGSMLVGRLAGGVVNWGPSQMRIKGAAGSPPGAANFILGSPLHVSTLPLGPNTICAAQIDPTGRLRASAMDRTDPLGPGVGEGAAVVPVVGKAVGDGVGSGVSVGAAVGTGVGRGAAVAEGDAVGDAVGAAVGLGVCEGVGRIVNSPASVA